MSVWCCKDCVPPKRHIGCHSTCEEYITSKKAYDEKMLREREEKEISNRIYEQRSKGIAKATRKCRKYNRQR